MSQTAHDSAITSLNKSVIADIETLMVTALPKRVALIGHGLESSIKEYQTQQAILGVSVTTQSTELDGREIALNELQRCDLAIITNVLEHLPKKLGMQLIAGVRDRLSSQFCVHYHWPPAGTDDTWQLTDFLSLGLIRVSDYHWQEQNSALFKYSIANYKRTPDWLNADNWANPELWGKYWW